eukprot:TRINITY_DN2649_c0_g1_i3.p1 TRINITY_DN2649_c0_g1~~TRINITY_DN2649_c0_g1_i3.p1  ORF type:complete len:173 (+),score=44.39 TRINITY_DN2649_c0_g1_i3:77-520(+)
MASPPLQDALQVADALLGDEALGEDLRGEVSGFAGGFEDQLAAARASTIKKQVTEFAKKFISGCREEANSGGSSYQRNMDRKFFNNARSRSKWQCDCKKLLLAELSKAGISKAMIWAPQPHHEILRIFDTRRPCYESILTCKLVWAK